MRHLRRDLETVLPADAITTDVSPWSEHPDSLRVAPPSRDALNKTVECFRETEPDEPSDPRPVPTFFNLVAVGGGCCPYADRRDQFISWRNPPDALLLLDTRRLNRVLDYSTQDLVLEVEAGMTLGAAQQLVAEHGHRIPLSAPFQDRATLGGIIACAAEGLTAAPYGQVRDQVLGLEVLDSKGNTTRAGGRVVKNVTGYDLCRLITGSRGSLGIITSVTLRLRPQERAEQSMYFVCRDTASACELAMDLRTTHPSLFGVLVLRAEPFLGFHSDDGELGVLALIRGEPSYVQAMVTALKNHPTGQSYCHLLDQDAWEDLQTLDAPLDRGLRLGFRPSQLQAVLNAATQSDAHQRTFVADVLAGRLMLAPPESAADEEQRMAPFCAEHQITVDRPGDPSFQERRFQTFPHMVPPAPDFMCEIQNWQDPLQVLYPVEGTDPDYWLPGGMPRSELYPPEKGTDPGGSMP